MIMWDGWGVVRVWDGVGWGCGEGMGWGWGMMGVRVGYVLRASAQSFKCSM